MRKETLQVSCGCLLHDVGKLVYRAGGASGSHSRLGCDFLKSLWPKEKAVLDCLRLHHSAELRAASPAKDSPAWIACVADNLSAAADRRELPEGEGGSFRRYTPLETVFTHMNGEHPGRAVPPRAQDGTLRMPEKGGAPLNAEQYQAAVEALRQRLAELEPEEDRLDSLLCLLESHTSMFPSSTYTGESADVSLFDHLKISAAIGACISEYLAESGERDLRKRLFDGEAEFRREKAFLLYSADFSGIQRFLYTVSSDKALRSLRSRSFFLELLMEHYCDELLHACGVSRANLLYTGGGHCYMLLPNTGAARDAAEKWNRRFNDWLCAEFGVSLFLAHGSTECSGNELTNTPAEEAPYKAMFRRVSAALARHKLHRYDAAQLRRLNSGARAGARECRVCGRPDALTDGRCPWCGLFAELSGKIQDCGLYLVSRDADAGSDFALPSLEGTAYVSLTDEKTARSRLNGGEAVVRLYSKNRAYTGLRYSTRLYVGDYAFSNSMEELSGSASGVKRIGVCRMDVDNLGQAFVSGFEREDADDAGRQRYVTLSRTAAFSRQMSLFFKCYINDVLSGAFGGKRKLAVAIVYSGGDDVFLVGAWNDSLEAAKRIRDAFIEYSCGSLTISAGVCVVDARFPVRLSAGIAGELEDRAKEEPGKDAVCLFDAGDGHCYRWERFKAEVMGEKLKALRDFFDADGQVRGNAFLYKLLELLRLARGAEGKLQLARYAYILARLEPPKASAAFPRYKKFAKDMYDWALDERDRACLITAIYIYAYENRKGDAD